MGSALYVEQWGPPSLSMSNNGVHPDYLWQTIRSALIIYVKQWGPSSLSTSINEVHPLRQTMGSALKIYGKQSGPPSLLNQTIRSTLIISLSIITVEEIGLP